MSDEQFRELIHVAQHELTRLNNHCQEAFGIGTFDHWQYEADEGTMVFTGGSMPSVRATVQVVGTTSLRSKSWLWAWANDSIPFQQTAAALAARAFGEQEAIPDLVSAELADDEYRGWEMTAVTVKIAGAIGGYRVPRESGGFSYYAFLRLEPEGRVELNHTA